MFIEDMLNQFKQLYRYREFIKNKVERNIKVRYRRSVLGFLWTMLNPLLMMLILTAVFSVLFRPNLPNVSYSAFALTGILFFNLFSEATNDGTQSVVGHGELLKKIYIPKIILPITSVISALVNFALDLIPLLAIYLFTGTYPGVKALYSIIAIVSLTIFSIGVAFTLSALAVFFRDVIYIYNLLLLALFYATPVFYPENIIPAKYRFVVLGNPLYYLLEGFRRPLLLNTLAPLEYYLIGGIASIIIFLFGFWIFIKLENHMLPYL